MRAAVGQDEKTVAVVAVQDQFLYHQNYPGYWIAHDLNTRKKQQEKCFFHLSGPRAMLGDPDRQKYFTNQQNRNLDNMRPEVYEHDLPQAADFLGNRYSRLRRIFNCISANTTKHICHLFQITTRFSKPLGFPVFCWRPCAGSTLVRLELLWSGKHHLR